MGQFPVETVISYLDTQEECLKREIAVDIGFVSCSLVHHARTLLTHVFVKQKTASRIFWIDSDIKWSPADFLKVLVHSYRYPVVCGVYPRRREPTAYFVKFPEGKEKEPPGPDGLVEIEGTGMGFCCVRRDVMQQLYDAAPVRRYGGGDMMPRVFRCDEDESDDRGEDYAFFADLKKLGHKIYADTTLSLGHVGTKVYTCPASA
jgi:hypothetical protein